METLTANGNNFADMIYTLRSNLRETRKLYILDAPASEFSWDNKYICDEKTIKEIMLTNMDGQLHTRFEKASAYDVLT